MSRRELLDLFGAIRHPKYRALLMLAYSAGLLSLSHPAGRSKARFLLVAGYRPENPEILAQDLLSIAYEVEVADVERSAHGMKYVIDGQVEAPRGYLIQLRTIWIIEGDHPPRFVTAYPRT